MDDYLRSIYLDLLGDLAEKAMGMSGPEAEEEARAFIFGPHCADLTRFCIGAGTTIKRYRKEIVELI